MKKIDVVILDDSLFVREALQQELERDVNIRVVGKAANAHDARDLIVELTPDLLISDVNLGGMSGTEFVRILLPQYYLPVIMMSSDASQRSAALQASAVDFVPKPVKGGSDEAAAFHRQMLAAVRAAVNGDKPPLAVELAAGLCIAVGASTGGAEAIDLFLKDMPSLMPPMVIVQHMPAGFTKSFSERMNQRGRLSVKEAEDGDVLIPGQAYIAPGGCDVQVRKRQNRFCLAVAPSVNPKKPSPNIDVAFHSVAETFRGNAIGVLMTGMGKDGAQGLKAIHDAGAATMAQDEESCVVYGMPRAAYEMGAVDYQLPPGVMRQKCIELLRAQGEGKGREAAGRKTVLKK